MCQKQFRVKTKWPSNCQKRCVNLCLYPCRDIWDDHWSSFRRKSCKCRESTQHPHKLQTLPNAQRTRGLSSAYESNLFRWYHKFLHRSWSNIFGILIKHQLQNINQTSALRQNLSAKLLTKPSFRISTKIELHSRNQASAAKSRPNFKICEWVTRVANDRTWVR